MRGGMKSLFSIFKRERYGDATRLKVIKGFARFM